MKIREMKKIILCFFLLNGFYNYSWGQNSEDIVNPSRYKRQPSGYGLWISISRGNYFGGFGFSKIEFLPSNTVYLGNYIYPIKYPGVNSPKEKYRVYSHSQSLSVGIGGIEMWIMNKKNNQIRFRAIMDNCVDDVNSSSYQYIAPDTFVTQELRFEESYKLIRIRMDYIKQTKSFFNFIRLYGGLGGELSGTDKSELNYTIWVDWYRDTTNQSYDFDIHPGSPDDKGQSKSIGSYTNRGNRPAPSARYGGGPRLQLGINALGGVEVTILGLSFFGELHAVVSGQYVWQSKVLFRYARGGSIGVRYFLYQ